MPVPVDGWYQDRPNGGTDTRAAIGGACATFDAIHSLYLPAARTKMETTFPRIEPPLAQVNCAPAPVLRLPTVNDTAA